MEYSRRLLSHIKTRYTSRVSSYLLPKSKSAHNHVPSLTTMSTAIVLHTLTQWTENHITANINSNNEQDLTSAIDAFLSKNATIVVNGVQISHAEFEKQLQLEKFDEVGAATSLVSAVQVSADKDNPFDVSSDNDAKTHYSIVFASVLCVE